MKHNVGMAIGGPKKGLRLACPDRTIQLCRMVRNERSMHNGDDYLPWVESDRGHYEFEAGHWWWKGWSLKR